MILAKADPTAVPSTPAQWDPIRAQGEVEQNARMEAQHKEIDEALKQHPESADPKPDGLLEAGTPAYTSVLLKELNPQPTPTSEAQ
jgi:hypothetical protein